MYPSFALLTLPYIFHPPKTLQNLHLHHHLPGSPKIMGKLKVGEEQVQEEEEEYTHDGTVDLNGRPAIRKRTGKWFAGFLILVNQGLATLAFFGVGVNLVLFMTRVLQQENAAAANTVSIWTGTVYIFSLVGAFLSDSYWGRYKTCVIFQAIFVVGLISLSLATHGFLLNRRSCGDATIICKPHSSWEIGVFYLSIYTIALGNGGYQPNIATFGADQFDEENAKEGHSKVAFFSYFYLALNLGQLFSDTVLGYFEDEGMWALGFWVSAASAFSALVLFLGGTKRYRYFKPSGNPLTRFSQVIVAATKKWNVDIRQGENNFHEESQNEGGERHLLHSDGFRFLDRAAIITSKDLKSSKQDYNSWRLCSVSQVEEVKCILRLLPIWLCTILYSVVFTQMSSLFVEQGAKMKNKVSNFEIPPASMYAFDIVTVAIFIFIYRKLLNPLVKGLTELQRMGIGLVLAIIAMVSAGTVENFRLKHAREDCILSIFWQVPQYAFIGASEVFMYVGQLEFFNAQAPDGLKSFGSALCMTSISLGNYASSLLVTVVVKLTTIHHLRGWIPENLNDGHLDRFYFLLAGLTSIDLVIYVFCARRYKSIRYGGSKFVEKSPKDCHLVV